VNTEKSFTSIADQQQSELLKKLKKLQNEADILSVANEGLKSQNEYLLKKFNKLETTYERLKEFEQTVEKRVIREIGLPSKVEQGK
jgi:translation initiation factor 2 alpha subunit (eIF-2alpha)